MKRTAIIFAALCLACLSATARQVSLDTLRSMVRPGESLAVTDSLSVQVRVSSEPGHPNLADGYQMTWRSSTSRDNNRTAYVQSEDGTAGAKLVFMHYNPEGMKAARYSLITLDLAGSVLRMTPKGALSIENLPNGCILHAVPGLPGDIVRKTARLSELTARDYHTWVTVEDCEFVFKDGAYINVLEQYTRPIAENRQYYPNNIMDTWQSLLCDSEMNPLYMVINARTPWRRHGAGVPQGRGSISGILVDSENPRYGHVEGWQIRPLEESDIDFGWKGESAFKTLCEWNWNDGKKAFNTTEGPVDKFTREKMIPDEGKGELFLDFTSSTYRGFDLNNPVLEPKDAPARGDKGKILYGAMEIRAQVCNWWNWGEDCGSAVVLKFSAAGLDAQRLFLAFSFSCGSNSAICSRFNPAFWGVEVSADNVHFARAACPDIEIRTLPWWEKDIEDVHYVTSAAAGTGMTEHIVELPSTLIGQETVYVRICPVRKALTTLAMDGSANAALRQNMNSWSYVSFGTITVRYR